MTSHVALFLVQASRTNAVMLNVLIFAVVIGVIIATLIASRKRDSEFAAAASALGFYPETNGTWPPQGAERIPLLQKRGTGNRVMRGAFDGREVVLADFSYRSGKSHIQQTVALFHTAGANLPAFRLRPEGVLDRVGAAIGFDDIDFTEHPAFSREYSLRGDDEQSIRALFDESTLSFFEQTETTKTIEASREWILVYTPATTVGVDALGSFLAESSPLAAAVAEAAKRSVHRS